MVVGGPLQRTTSAVKAKTGESNTIYVLSAPRSQDGKPTYAYNFLGLQRYTVATAQSVPAGKATILLEFSYDGGGLAKGGLGSLFVNDAKVAEGRIEGTQPMIFSADETADVGEDDATPVTEEYKAYDNKFTGRILKVPVDVKPMGAGEKVAARKASAEAAGKLEAAD